MIIKDSSMVAFGNNDKTIIAGVLTAIVSSACQSVGLILQRKSHLKYENVETGYKAPYERSLWRIGFLLFIIANIFGSSIQITTLPLILLSPLQSIGLVFNTAFSCMILNEVFNRFALIGTILISVGAFLIALFGALPEPDYDLTKFLIFLKRKQFITWCLIDLTYVLLLLAWIILSKQVAENGNNKNKYHKLARDEEDAEQLDDEEDDDVEDDESSILNGNIEVVSISTNEDQYERFLLNNNINQPNYHDNENYFLLQKKHFINFIKHKKKAIINKLRKTCLNISPENSKLVRGIFCGIISGTLSAHSLLLAKSTIEVLLNAFLSSSKKFKNMNQPMVWIIIITFLTLCLLQLWFLNRGLKIISTSVLYPLVFCVYNITNIINGLIFFNQWEVITYWELFNICLGSILVFIGVFALSWRFNDKCEVNGIVGYTSENSIEIPSDMLHDQNLHSNYSHHYRNSSEYKSHTNELSNKAERSSLISSTFTSPKFRNYFTFTPIRDTKNSLRITQADDDETHYNNDNGASGAGGEQSYDVSTPLEAGNNTEYISFGSPKSSPIIRHVVSGTRLASTPPLTANPVSPSSKIFNHNNINNNNNTSTPVSSTRGDKSEIDFVNEAPTPSRLTFDYSSNTPTKLRDEIISTPISGGSHNFNENLNFLNGFHATEADHALPISVNGGDLSINNVHNNNTINNADGNENNVKGYNSENRTKRNRYGSIGDIFSNITNSNKISGGNRSFTANATVGDSNGSNKDDFTRRHSKRMLSFEQNELLSQLTKMG